MEIIRLTCVASWWAGFCLVYTGFTWYISDEKPETSMADHKGNNKHEKQI